jgi:hypothetical protein
MSNKKTALLTGALVVASIVAIHVHRARAGTVNLENVKVACLKLGGSMEGEDQEVNKNFQDAIGKQVGTGSTGYYCYFRFTNAPTCIAPMAIETQNDDKTCELTSMGKMALKMMGFTNTDGKIPCHPGKKAGTVCLFPTSEYHGLLQANEQNKDLLEMIQGNKGEYVRKNVQDAIEALK